MNDAVLMDAIGRARQRLVFIEPSVRPAVACALERAMAVVASGHATLEVGQDPVDQRKVAAVKKDLSKRPPKEFNIARLESVFSTMLQHMEFEIENYKISTRTLRLDAELFGIKDEMVAQRLASRSR